MEIAIVIFICFLLAILFATCDAKNAVDAENETLQRQVELLTAERDSIFRRKEEIGQQCDVALSENARVARIFNSIAAAMDEYQSEQSEQRAAS